MKILFLDIDGVLNSRRSAVAMRGYPHPSTEEEKFDFIAVNLIKRICESGVKIVLSSTWRMDKNYKMILDLPIIDRTPVISGIRGKEIKAWLDDHPEIEDWVIVDDDDDMLPEQFERFVHVDRINGLSFEDYDKVCIILKIPR